MAKAIVENYRAWAAVRHDLAPKSVEERSSTLFDCVAIYLAVSDALCQMETLGIRVTDDGFTRLDPAAKTMRVATAWKDLNAFREWMVARLAR